MYQAARLWAKGDADAAHAAEAIRWFRRAALAGHVAAAYHVGRQILGQGGKAGNVEDGRATEAEPWLRKAAMGGHPGAQIELAKLLRVGKDGVAKDDAAARRLKEL